MRCDAIADAILIATRATPLEIPLVVRLAGTNSGLALRRLKDSGPPMIFANDLADAAEKAVRSSLEIEMNERRHWWQRTVGHYPKA
jgi:succinyl-CoA synthetase beta subunit